MGEIRYQFRFSVVLNPRILWKERGENLYIVSNKRKCTLVLFFRLPCPWITANKFFSIINPVPWKSGFKTTSPLAIIVLGLGTIVFPVLRTALNRCKREEARGQDKNVWSHFSALSLLSMYIRNWLQNASASLVYARENKNVNHCAKEMPEEKSRDVIEVN